MLALSITTLSFLNQGCDADNVIGAIVGAVVGGIAADADLDYGSCQPGYKNVCHDYRDVFGEIRYECKQVWDDCYRYDHDRDWNHGHHRPGRGNGRHSVDFVQAVNETAAKKEKASEIKIAEIQKAGIAQSYGMGFEASDRLVNALVKAKGGDLQPAYDLGLSKKDFKALSKGQQLSEESLTSLAKGLNMDIEATASMTKSIAEQVKATLDAERAESIANNEQ